MKLIDYYEQSKIGLSAKDAKTNRTRWHQATKRHCNFRWLTSDPLPAPSVRRVYEDVKDDTSPTYQVTTIIFDPFFTRFPDAELEEVYRVTKTRNTRTLAQDVT